MSYVKAIRLVIGIVTLFSAAFFPAQTFGAQPSKVISVAWSPDGTKLAMSSEDGIICVVDLTSGKTLLNIQGHTDAIWAIAWRPDGAQIASASEDTLVKVWNASTGALVFTFSDYEYAAYSVAWSPDSTKFMSLSAEDIINTVRDSQTGEILQRIDTGNSYSLAWHPDSKTIALTNVYKIALIDISVPERLPPYHSPTVAIRSVAWKPNGAQIAGGGYDGSVTIWETISHQVITVLHTQSRRIASVAWSPDGTKLASASEDGTLVIWDTSTWRAIDTLKSAQTSIYAVSWHPNSAQLAYADGSDNPVIVTLQEGKWITSKPVW